MSSSTEVPAPDMEAISTGSAARARGLAIAEERFVEVRSHLLGWDATEREANAKSLVQFFIDGDLTAEVGGDPTKQGSGVSWEDIWSNPYTLLTKRGNSYIETLSKYKDNRAATVPDPEVGENTRRWNFAVQEIVTGMTDAWKKLQPTTLSDQWSLDKWQT